MADLPVSPLTRPHRLIPLLAGLQAFSPLSLDMYLPALPRIAEDLATSEARVQLSITSYLVGLFLGMLFFGPLSDKYGRRKLILGGIVVYIIAGLGCAMANSVDSLVSWRFVQALGGGAASILGRAIVRDIFPLKEAAKALSSMHLITMMAALSAPMLGSLLLLAGSWRWMFFVLIVFASIWLWLIAWKVPETHYGESRNSGVLKVYRAYGTIGSQPRALGYILCMSLCFAGMFAYITASPFVFMDYYGLSPTYYALLFAGNTAGIMALVTVNVRLVARVGPQKMLYGAAVLLAVSSVVLLLAGTLTSGGLWLLVVGLFGYISCTGLMGANCTASLMTQFPDNAGAAAGLALAVQFGLGAVMSLLVSALYEGTPFAMTLIVGLCGLGSIAALSLTRHDTTAKN
jgi:DHA1 family bicyclomycin/chloramphenicol resistance-like MFS transporter